MTLSLLAHLYSYIRGSQEDVATLSLQYILKQSPDLNAAFTRLVSKALQVEPGEEIHYVCQVKGDNKERPDIAGISDSGKEMILCEAKFYAGLTINQPSTYLDRLKKENGLGLVFICPAARKITLWSKLLELCEHRKLEKNDEYCVTVDGVRMSIITWGEIIETLRFVASTLSVSSLSDIDQLDGFCRLVDETSFIPFEQEDFGPENARREERHYEILDALFNYLIADKSLHANANYGQQHIVQDTFDTSALRDMACLFVMTERCGWKTVLRKLPIGLEFVKRILTSLKAICMYLKDFLNHGKRRMETLTLLCLHRSMLHWTRL